MELRGKGGIMIPFSSDLLAQRSFLMFITPPKPRRAVSLCLIVPVINEFPWVNLLLGTGAEEIVNRKRLPRIAPLFGERILYVRLWVRSAVRLD